MAAEMTKFSIYEFSIFNEFSILNEQIFKRFENYTRKGSLDKLAPNQSLALVRGSGWQIGVLAYSRSAFDVGEKNKKIIP